MVQNDQGDSNDHLQQTGTLAAMHYRHKPQLSSTAQVQLTIANILAVREDGEAQATTLCVGQVTGEAWIVSIYALAASFASPRSNRKWWCLPYFLTKKLPRRILVFGAYSSTAEVITRPPVAWTGVRPGAEHACIITRRCSR